MRRRCCDAVNIIFDSIAVSSTVKTIRDEQTFHRIAKMSCKYQPRYVIREKWIFTSGNYGRDNVGAEI